MALIDWFVRWRERRQLARHAIPDELWALVTGAYPFLISDAADPAASALRRLVSLFLARKEFIGAQGLVVDDTMAVVIAAQACLPILHRPEGLAAYDGFIGIVVHPDEVVARREDIDDDGVVHEWDEHLTGEAMQGGPLMLAWSDVAQAGSLAEEAYNVVIHEFAHIIDMADGEADGVPPLPGTASRAAWLAVIEPAFDDFCRRVDNGESTVIDPYGAEAPEEFFAVACEAFFTAPQAMRAELPALYGLLSDYFRQDPASAGRG
ncbi:zinc-dependent peptidase [Ideonella margarita]|uniref:M90 family metallopeptidase n=1 Tax=Ideonella margarita TaxID=2984191 RepID=A0ABU9C684_9BURK